VTLWKSIDLTSLLDSESSRPITALQVLEAIDWNSAGTSGELQQATLLFGIPCADDLPEVLNDFVLLLVAAVVGMFLPVVNIDIGNAADQKLKFTFVKYVDKIRRNEFVEACNKGIELFFDPLDNLPFSDEPVNRVSLCSFSSTENDLLNVFPLVFISDLDVTSTRLEIDCSSFTKLLVFDSERLVEDVCDVVVQCPGQVLVILFVDAFHIIYGDLLPQHHLVKCTDEK
jgi:hypothetical protein